MELDRFLRHSRFLTLLSLLLLVEAPLVLADSATWNSNPATGDWNTATNWTPAAVPDGPSDIATFASSSRTAVSLSDVGGTEVNGITFDVGASAYTITVSPTASMTVSGVGITNSSGLTQTFVNDVDTAAHRAVTVVSNSATLGDSTYIQKAGLLGGPGAQLQLTGSASGGTARVQVFGNATFDLSAHDATSVSVGSIEGTGLVTLGATNLTTGSNNINTTFSGVLSGTGSLTKTGTSIFTLGKTNTYTGGTTVSQGTLFVSNASGTATGFGAVQVNAGTLAGIGRIAGDVTIGPATNSAIVDPGLGKHLGTLTFSKTITFNFRANLKLSLNSTSVTTDQVVAKGVTINTGALISIGDLGTAVLPPGTVFTLISNTGLNPIAGTFRNLIDGSSLVVGNNTYLVSYAGGTGNDLTLTVQ